jgi:hypothetical protein
MKRSAMLFLATCLLLAAMPAFAAKKATVKIINQSHWSIHHLYLSTSDDQEWGDDQLGEDVLDKGDSFTITDIPCDVYDVKVVDEDGDECVIEAAKLCNDNSYWKITDKELLSCEGESE